MPTQMMISSVGPSRYQHPLWSPGRNSEIAAGSSVLIIKRYDDIAAKRTKRIPIRI